MSEPTQHDPEPSARPARPRYPKHTVRKWTCVICEIICAPGIVQQSHTAGAKHIKKLAQVKRRASNTSEDAPTPEGWRCQLCETSFAADDIESHLGSVEHGQKAILRFPRVPRARKANESGAAAETGQDGDAGPTDEAPRGDTAAGDDDAEQAHGASTAGRGRYRGRFHWRGRGRGRGRGGRGGRGGEGREDVAEVGGEGNAQEGQEAGVEVNQGADVDPGTGGNNIEVDGEETAPRGRGRGRRGRGGRARGRRDGGDEGGGNGDGSGSGDDSGPRGPGSSRRRGRGPRRGRGRGAAPAYVDGLEHTIEEPEPREQRSGLGVLRGFSPPVRETDSE